MGKGVLDAVAEDPLERERKSWPEREEREEQAAHAAIVAFEPDDTLMTLRLAGVYVMDGLRRGQLAVTCARLATYTG